MAARIISIGTVILFIYLFILMVFISRPRNEAEAESTKGEKQKDDENEKWKSMSECDATTFFGACGHIRSTARAGVRFVITVLLAAADIDSRGVVFHSQLMGDKI